MRNLLAGIAAGLALVPLAASAITADDLTAQVASLLAQLNQLQQQLSSLTSGVAPRASVSPLPSTAACPAVIRNLSRGMRGDDVMSLQKFLVAQGSLDADAATGFFGALTEASIKKWQGDHDIVSGGTASTTGWGTVGARTRAAMLSACGGEAAPGNDTLSVSVRGLDASADATVNTRGSCEALTYSLGFGDGTPVVPISVEAGTCHAVSKSFDHNFSSAGKYQIVLSSRTSKLTVPVTVKPVERVPIVECVAPAFAFDSVPSAQAGVPWSLTLVTASTSSNMPFVTASGLPPGITLQNVAQVSARTGSTTRAWILTGTATTTGMYSVAISAQNTCGKATRTMEVPVNSASSLRSTGCTQRLVPWCPNGTVQSLGNDSNGCGLGYECVAQRMSCPILNTPVCSAGQKLQSGGMGPNGCQLAPQCVSDPLSNIPASVTAQFNALIPTYGNSLGVSISRCVRSGNDEIYTVTGSGGYTAITYYFNGADGRALGSVSFSDTPPFQTGVPPVDTSLFTCTQIRHS